MNAEQLLFIQQPQDTLASKSNVSSSNASLPCRGQRSEHIGLNRGRGQRSEHIGLNRGRGQRSEHIGLNRGVSTSLQEPNSLVIDKYDRGRGQRSDR